MRRSSRGNAVPTRFANASLVVLAILVGWTLTEVAARSIAGPPRYLGDRVVLFSKPHWQHAPDGSLRYAPHSRVREVAVYGRHFEYDVTFQTNNLGFIDARDYHKAGAGDRRTRFAFVGDSMTAGYHGGAPWVPLLRDQAERKNPAVEIYNLGIGGVGLAQFYMLLKHVEGELDIDRIVVLFITHDLFRSRVNVIEDGGLIYVCPVEISRSKCVSAETRMMVMRDREMTQPEILEAIRERGLVSEPSGLGEWFERNTYLGSILARDVYGRESFEETARALGKHFRELALFEQFRDGFPGKRIVFVHLPMKEEAIHETYYLDVSADVRRAGVGYVSILERCDLEESDYHDVDPHPNRSGYEKIRRCVGRELGLL